MNFPTFSAVIIIVLGFAYLGECSEEENESETPQGTRSVRSPLPSVSRDHYSEVLSDGTYKYAYTGEHRYVAERRLADGSVEGESLFVRPDGIPVKVHYFADKEGYRPKTEVLYKERLVSARTYPSSVIRSSAPVPVREVIVPGPPPPSVVLPPPISSSTGPNSVNVNLGGGVAAFRSSGGNGGDINVNTNGGGGDVAAASPSVTAIVGPGGQAVVRPEAVARTSGRSSYFRSGGGGGGDVAIANPHTTAIVGAGGSVVVEPKATAYVGGQPEVVKEVHHHTQSVVRTAPEIQRIVEKVHVPVPVPVEATRDYHHRGYVYEPPRPAVVVPPPTVAVQSSGVLLVPPSSRYSYSYGYSAPDPKNPQRDNSAYVNVQVNQ